MKVLITGSTGFVGSHLLDYYLEKYPEYELFATKRWRSDMSNVVHIQNKITWYDMDVTDAHSVDKVIK